MIPKIVDTSRVLAIIPAGGIGSRLEPLTRLRSKPAVFFAGGRLISISITNLLHSFISRIYTIVMRHPASLEQYFEGFHESVALMRGQFIRRLTPPLETDPFLSEAHALLQLRQYFESDAFDLIVVTMSDQVVKIDFRTLISAMLDAQADAALVYRAVPREVACGQLGVVTIDASGKVLSLAEKPQEPVEAAHMPGMCLGNVAMYCFRKKVFSEMLDALAVMNQPDMNLSSTGMQWLIEHKQVLGFDLLDGAVPGQTEHELGFFRDIGTLQSWYETQMMLCSRNPVYNVYSEQWPLLMAAKWPMSPCKFDRVRKMEQGLFGFNVICQDDIAITHSLICNDAHIGYNSEIARSVILPSARIGSNCVIDRVVIEKEVVVPNNTILSPEHPPGPTLSYDELYQAVITGAPVDESLAVLCNNLLVIPKHFSFRK